MYKVCDNTPSCTLSTRHAIPTPAAPPPPNHRPVQAGRREWSEFNSNTNPCSSPPPNHRPVQAGRLEWSEFNSNTNPCSSPPPNHRHVQAGRREWSEFISDKTTFLSSMTVPPTVPPTAWQTQEIQLPVQPTWSRQTHSRQAEHIDMLMA